MVNPIILFPLYIYPSYNAWGPLYTQISNYPSIQFNLVIDISDGPGSNGAPDYNYMAGIAKLNTYSNTLLLGYVHTSEATRNYTRATADIDAYTTWISYPTSDLHMDGIFFDEAPSDTDDLSIQYMTNITSYARTKLKLPSGAAPYFVFNPGVPVDSVYYNMADLVIAFEDYYRAYKPSSVNAVQTSQRAKSAFVIHDFTGTTATQATTISQLVAANVPAVYITTQPSYNAFSSLFASFCLAMSTGGTQSTVTTTTSAIVSKSKRAPAFLEWIAASVGLGRV